MDTRIGKLEFTHDFANGYPTRPTVDKLYEERDFQRACRPTFGQFRQLFWSVTLYDVDTRSLLVNEQKIADRSSRMDLKKNADSSVDIYCGAAAPAGFESNWIPTVPGKSWFAYFRLYEPTESYFDKSWPLGDFEKTK